MKSKEALERLLMLARPCAYEVREHRNSYCDMLENTIKQGLERLEQLEKENQEFKELVEFLIKHLYVAPELLELRVAPKHNHIWDGWRHNGIKVQNDDFWKHIKLINKLKKEIGNYE